MNSRLRPGARAFNLKRRRVSARLEQLEPRRLLATIIVNTGNDETTPDSTLSLREALAYVNTISPVDGDTIAFAAGLTGTITLTQGPLPAIAADVAIIGPGANLLSIDGYNGSSILSVQVGSKVILSGLSLVDGNSAIGGAIQNLGTLAMSACTVSGNHASGFRVRTSDERRTEVNFDSPRHRKSHCRYGSRHRDAGRRSTPRAAPGCSENVALAPMCVGKSEQFALAPPSVEPGHIRTAADDRMCEVVHTPRKKFMSEIFQIGRSRMSKMMPVAPCLRRKSA